MAHAHQRSLVALDLTLDGDELALDLRGSAHDLAPTLGWAAAGSPSPKMYLANSQRVLKHIAAYLTVERDGRHLCRVRQSQLQVLERREVAVHLLYDCVRKPEVLSLRYDLLFDQDHGHRAIVRVGGRKGASHLLDHAHRVVQLEQEVSLLDNVADFLVLGIEHIFSGYDHILFLLALLLTAGTITSQASGQGARSQLRAGILHLLSVVSAFTVAHSVTLIVAALGIVTLSPRVVEPAIALTIAYVGLENVVRQRPRWRWQLTFAFGLIHGFGFASILRDVGLPRRGLVLSLLSFNLGVELGQLAVVSLLFPVVTLLAWRKTGWGGTAALLLLLGLFFALLAATGIALTWQAPLAGVVLVCAIVGVRRLGYRKAVVTGGSTVITSLALLWFVERVFGVTFLSGHLG